VRKLIVLGLLAVSLHASATGFLDVQFLDPDYLDEQFLQSEGIGAPDPCPGCVPVPDVVGELTFGAADTILEGDGLDGLEAEVCSSVANNVVVGQSPADGTLVPLATVVLVTTSNGVACKGRPPLWLFMETDR
jgi:hypothetical protein